MQQIIREILPQIQEKYAQKRQDYSAEIFEGTRGIKYFFDSSLSESKKKDEILVIGYSPEASKLFNAYFKEFHKKRIRKGVHARVIYNYEAWFGKKREKRKLIEQRYLKKGVQTPAFIYIFSDTVGTIIITDNQKACLAVKNKEVSDSYKNYFEILWKDSVKTGK